MTPDVYFTSLISMLLLIGGFYLLITSPDERSEKLNTQDWSETSKSDNESSSNELEMESLSDSTDETYQDLDMRSESLDNSVVTELSFHMNDAF